MSTVPEERNGTSPRVEKTGPPLSIQGEEIEWGPGLHPAVDDDTPPEFAHADEPSDDDVEPG
ncbi:hypothetical protein DPM19_25225 [Actinomadura craniellae]|uniref:Uncharacterized protein n=1 Tax=Actinomadura craniellae TaxID=2231787 RepID=A0A365H0A9_9ACTN|nr:hypothetical protein [Actinomadura craniellae]RAY12448.1 hypothetical protein DPM19_25225 [Actinomadura craniellae]